MRIPLIPTIQSKKNKKLYYLQFFGLTCRLLFLNIFNTLKTYRLIFFGF